MAPPNIQTSYFLDSQTGWRMSRESAHVAAGATLRLSSVPEGPGGFRSPDGSLGGLVVPSGFPPRDRSAGPSNVRSGFALDGEGVVYRFTGPLVERYEAQVWVALPVRRPGVPCGDEPYPWTSMAATGTWLALASGPASQASVHHTGHLGVVAHWPIACDDIAAHCETFFLLCRDGVHAAAAPFWQLQRIIPAGPDWDRIAVDRLGRLVLRRGREPVVDIYERAGSAWQKSASAEDPEELRSSFPAPLVRLVAGEKDPRFSPALPTGHRVPQPEGDETVEAGGIVYTLDYSARTLTLWNGKSQLQEAAWGPLDESLREVPRFDAGAWDPADLVLASGRVWWLDRRHNRVLSHAAGEPAPRVAVAAEGPARWARLAAFPNGCLILFDARGVDRPYLVFSMTGELVAERETCEVTWPKAQAHRITAEEKERAWRAYLAPAPNEDRYRAAGDFVSLWLDSGIYDCVWHRLMLKGVRLPQGTRLRVFTVTANDPNVLPLPERVMAWEGPKASDGRRPVLDLDALVRSKPGRWMRIHLELTGDVRQTPSVESIRAQYPRDSQLDRLPAIFREDPEGAEFLDRFLSIASEEWRSIEARMEEVATWYDPLRVPPGPPLERLAEWLSVKLPVDWSTAQHRQLLVGAQSSLRLRGTPEGLRLALSAVLAAIRGVSAEEVRRSGWPVVWERFQDRPWPVGRASLNQLVLAAANPLERFQLGVTDADATYRMISPDRPEEDQHRVFSCRCRVLIPDGWLTNERDLAIVQETLRREMPAHVTAELEFVSPALRVGVQSKVGVDMVVAAPPASILPAAEVRLTSEAAATIPICDLGRGAPLS